MSFVRFVARFLLVAIFLLSGFSKLNDIVKANGDVTATKGFSYAVQGLNGLPKEISSQIPPDAYQYLYLTAVASEVTGGLLLALGSTFGAWILFLSVSCITPVMHKFWGAGERGNGLDEGQMIHFLKNVAIAGGLLAFAASGSIAAGKSGKKKWE